MDTATNIFFKNEFVEQYDDLVKKQKWYGVEVLFGMMFEFLNQNDVILDVGIGTGLSAENFHATGMEVYGLDYSDEMLEMCKQKNITVDLKQFDLTNSPLPYNSDFFDHISANAVLYFIENLDELFSEIQRILKTNGVWAFIIEEHNKNDIDIIEKPKAKNGLVNYSHSQKYVSNLISENKFTILKKLEFVAENFQMQGKSVTFVAYICRG